jgi:ABC-type sulfate/molybdate transport systems ATPase subunit
MPDAALSVRVKHRRGGFLLDVDFEIARWPALLFGPSGAGKSSLLRLIAGLDQPGHGRIEFGGQVLTGANRGIQLVSQRSALFPHLSVRENVGFGVRGLSRDEREGRILTLLTAMHAVHLVDRRPESLSAGERQRVALARALAPGPKLLLLDEAVTGLDGVLKQEILEALTALLADRRVMALHVTHDVGDAFALDAEVVKLRAGHVEGQGPVGEVLAEERSRLLGILGQSVEGGTTL